MRGWETPSGPLWPLQGPASKWDPSALPAQVGHGWPGDSRDCPFPPPGTVPPSTPHSRPQACSCNPPVTSSLSVPKSPPVPSGWSSPVAAFIPQLPHTSPSYWPNWTVPRVPSTVSLPLLGPLPRTARPPRLPSPTLSSLAATAPPRPPATCLVSCSLHNSELQKGHRVRSRPMHPSVCPRTKPTPFNARRDSVGRVLSPHLTDAQRLPGQPCGLRAGAGDLGRGLSSASTAATLQVTLGMVTEAYSRYSQEAVDRGNSVAPARPR